MKKLLIMSLSLSVLFSPSLQARPIENLRPVGGTSQTTIQNNIQSQSRVNTNLTNNNDDSRAIQRIIARQKANSKTSKSQTVNKGRLNPNLIGHIAGMKETQRVIAKHQGKKLKPSKKN